MVCCILAIIGFAVSLISIAIVMMMHFLPNNKTTAFKHGYTSLPTLCDPEIQMGVVTTNVSQFYANNGEYLQSGIVNITFPRAFTTIPNVYIMDGSGSSGLGTDLCHVASTTEPWNSIRREITNVSTTGFSLRVITNNKATGALTNCWLAINLS